MMRSLSGLTALPSIFICCLAGCSPQDEPADESVDEAALAGAADGAYTYFRVTADLRKCASPLCGGWFVNRLNRPTTQCHDGRNAATCYAPVLDWSETRVSEDDKAQLLDASRQDALSAGVHAIARGRFAPTNSTPRPELGRFVITEAWVAEGTGVASGVFVKVKDNGRRCPAAPCPSLTEQTLNTPRSAAIAAIDWTPAGMSDDQIAQFIRLLHTPDGVIVAGDRYLVHEHGRTAETRTATAAYARLADAAP